MRGPFSRAPLAAFPRLRDATAERLDAYVVEERGTGIHWPEVDEDTGVAYLIGSRRASCCATPKISTARAELALLPDHDKMRSFDEVAQLVASLPAALDAVTPDQVKQLLAMVVEKVTTKDRVVDEIRLRPPLTPAPSAPTQCSPVTRVDGQPRVGGVDAGRPSQRQDGHRQPEREPTRQLPERHSARCWNVPSPVEPSKYKRPAARR